MIPLLVVDGTVPQLAEVGIKPVFHRRSPLSSPPGIQVALECHRCSTNPQTGKKAAIGLSRPQILELKGLGPFSPAERVV